MDVRSPCYGYTLSALSAVFNVLSGSNHIQSFCRYPLTPPARLSASFLRESRNMITTGINWVSMTRECINRLPRNFILAKTYGLMIRILLGFFIQNKIQYKFIGITRRLLFILHISVCLFYAHRPNTRKKAGEPRKFRSSPAGSITAYLISFFGTRPENSR